MDKVAYLGPEETFGHKVTRREFGRTHELVACPSHAVIVSMVATGAVDRGVVAVENALLGPVPDTLVAMGRHAEKCYAVRQFSLSIDMRLWQNPDSARLDQVFIFSAAAAQCSNLIAQLEESGVRVLTASSTADSLRKASETLNSAGIGSPAAGERYGLKDISQVFTARTNCSVADATAEVNNTRFWELTCKMSESGAANRTVLRMQMPNQPGTLARALSCFGARGINMSLLFSAPVPGRPWEYAFYADFDASQREDVFRAACFEAANVVAPFSSQVLGCYVVS